MMSKKLCRYQRLHAGIPSLLLDFFLEAIAVNILALHDPAFSLNDLERIGRCHQNLGQQCVWVERNRRHQRIKLLGFQELLVRSLGRGIRVLRPGGEGQKKKKRER